MSLTSDDLSGSSDGMHSDVRQCPDLNNIKGLHFTSITSRLFVIKHDFRKSRPEVVPLITS